MPRFLSLVNFTDQGIADVKHSIDRANAFRSSVESAGGTVESLFWAFGDNDGVVIFQAPDDITAASILLGVGHQGHVRTKTQRLFDEEEFAQVIAKMN